MITYPLVRILLAFTVLALTRASINWYNLSNPVLQYSNWSIKDDFIQYNPNDYMFYVYFSAFYEDNGQIRSHVAMVATPNFVTYSILMLDFSGQEQGYIGMCSPSVTVWNNSATGAVYYLTFNSWGNDPKHENQLFYMYSKDMRIWSDMLPLAPNLTPGQIAIDSCLAFDGDKTILIYKNDGPGIPVFAVADKMSFDFTFLGNPTLLWANGTESDYTHENYQLLQVDGIWLLLCTDYVSETHWPYIYTMTTPGNWLHWSGGYMFDVAEQGWNTDNVANAAAIADMRAYDGTTEHTTYIGRGWNRLGLSRSKDLKKWFYPGQF